jgi:hypothetical protein
MDSSRVQHSSGPSHGLPIEATFGKIISPSSIIEFIQSQCVNRNRLALLHWDNGQASVTDELILESIVYQPGMNQCASRMRWPAELGESCCIDELFEKLRRIVEAYLELPAGAIDVLLHFILCTWFADLLVHTPVLLVRGGPSAEMQNLGLLLQALCRRALTVTGVNSRTFEHLPFELQPTLIVRQPKVDISAQTRLGDFSEKDSWSPQSKIVGTSHCAMAFITEQAINDSRLLYRALHLPWLLSKKPPIRGCLDRIAAEMQPLLLRFRVERIQDVTSSDRFDIEEMSLYRNSKPLTHRVREVMRLREEESVLDREDSLPSLLLEALLYVSHKNVQKIHVGKIHEIVRNISSGRGNHGNANDRGIGSELKNLGFRTCRLDSGGRGLVLDRSIHEQIHREAKRFSVPSSMPFENCEYCMLP